jgi:hypothetical protein
LCDDCKTINPNGVNIAIPGGAITVSSYYDAANDLCVAPPTLIPPNPCDGILQRLYSTINEKKLLANKVAGWERQLVSCRNQQYITEAEYIAAISAINSLASHPH